MLVRFESFRIDLVDERLWRDQEPLHLTRKAWGVLRVLLESAGRLVTKEQLIQAVWNGTAVGDDSLTKAVRELRRVLGDDQRAPQFIATVHGRGYRFIAALETPAPHAPASIADRIAPLIGRGHELATLLSWLDDARLGRRQVGVVSGEVGIGKSRLVAAFLEALEKDTGNRLHVAGGRCVEQYGEAEPFLPVIEALRRLARQPSAAATMRAAAPAWLAAACGLTISSESAEAIGSREGVLRILAEVIETIANETPLVMLLKDLHWSDPSTLDLINLLARRADPARLLVLLTLRYSEALGAGHPSAALVRELRRTEHCREITLTPFTPDDVDRYLAARLGDNPPPEASDYVFRHTGGNPFFVRALVDDVLARQSLRHDSKRWVLDVQGKPPIPAGSLAALSPRLERLSDSERRMLEVASVGGDLFSAEVIAAALASEPGSETSLEDVEVVCDSLARHQDILRTGDGGAPYAFQHVLYRQALYEGIPPARRRRLHGAVGDWLARQRPADSTEGAAELAEHFARAGEHGQAANYHAEAALAARGRYADREVAAQLSAALHHLMICPHSLDRDLQELMLVQQYATATIALTGFGDPAIADACQRAQGIARRLNMPLPIFMTTAALTFLHIMRAELHDAAALADELRAMATSLPFEECTTAANAATAVVLCYRGDPAGAKRWLDAAPPHLLPRESPGFAFDALVWMLSLRAMVEADLGRARAARDTVGEMLAAVTDGSAAHRAVSYMLVALIEAQLHDARSVLEHVEMAMRERASDDASPIALATADQLRGWALAILGDAAGSRAAYADRGKSWRATGQRLATPLYAMLRAEAALYDNDLITAHASIRFGLDHAAETGEHRVYSELHRLHAECLRRSGKMERAAAELATALRIAAEQGARLAELRAAIDNFCLHRSGKGQDAAEQRLASVVGSFDPDEPLAELAVAANLLRGDFSAA